MKKRIFCTVLVLFLTAAVACTEADIQNIKNGKTGGRGRTAEDTTALTTSTFKKPTLEEIKEYITETKATIDPQAFYDYYTKIGWVYGKNKTPIKDWKACVRTWERNNKTYGAEDVLHSTSSEVL